MNRPRWLSPTLIAALLILSLQPPPAGGPVAAASMPLDARTEASLDLAPQPPINIHDDDAFADHPAVRSGQGTDDDPYLITNWTILPHPGATISIDGTSAHIEMNNLYLPGHAPNPPPSACHDPVMACSNPLIHLTDTSNITIRNVHGHAAHTGILIEKATSIHIDTLALTPLDDRARTQTGLEVQESSDITVRNATLHDIPHAIHLHEASNTMISDATIQSNETPSRSTIQASSNVTIQRVDAHRHGFQLASPDPPRIPSKEPTISGFTFQNNHVHSSPIPSLDQDDETPHRTTICGNSFTDISAHAAVSLWHAPNLTMTGNSISNVSGQALDIDGTDVTITKNLIRDVRDGDAGLTLHAEDTNLTGNAFMEMDAVTILGDGTDASDNWWGHASGPSGTDDGGKGTLVVPHGNDIKLYPWREEAPSDVGPEAVTCGQGLPPGAQQLPDLSAALQFEAAITWAGQGSVSQQASAHASTPLPP